jgi:tRNA threonylcarbamoyladenosine biosynthesis protein TsaE
MILEDEAATEALGRRLAGLIRADDVVTLSGPLGVGKTALARGLIRGLGHEGDVPSPSFAIVQPYDDIEPPIWHVDLFRLEDAGELDELGLDSSNGAALLVEWPERARESAWPDALRLVLEFDQGGARRLTASLPPAWQDRWPPR